MSTNEPGVATDAAAAEAASWRDRAVERSLRGARAKAMSRSDRFIDAAMEILSETGRTDFTVQELIERSKTSLRSFYQHFSGKEELLLALFEEVITTTSADWRAEVESLDALTALRELLEGIYGQAGGPDGGGINRALSVFHLHLAESRPAEYARVLAPLRALILEQIEKGVAEQTVRSDLDAETLATIVLQTLVGAAHMHALGVAPNGGAIDSDRLWEFCLGGLKA
jgi:AcrR family transcriptional regulator